MDTHKYVLANKSNHEDEYTHYYCEVCILLTISECVTLQLLHKWRFNGTSYNVSWDEIEISNTKHIDVYDKVTMRDSIIKSCAQDHSLFNMDIETDYNPNTFLWKLVVSNTNDLASKSNFEEENKYYYYGGCVPVTNNEFATLR